MTLGDPPPAGAVHGGADLRVRLGPAVEPRASATTSTATARTRAIGRPASRSSPRTARRSRSVNLRVMHRMPLRRRARHRRHRRDVQPVQPDELRRQLDSDRQFLSGPTLANPRPAASGSTRVTGIHRDAAAVRGADRVPDRLLTLRHNRRDGTLTARRTGTRVAKPRTREDCTDPQPQTDPRGRIEVVLAPRLPRHQHARHRRGRARSTGNVYHHFPDKESIFTALIQEYLEAISSPDHPFNRALIAGVFPVDLEQMARAARTSIEETAITPC